MDRIVYLESIVLDHKKKKNTLYCNPDVSNDTFTKIVKDSLNSPLYINIYYNILIMTKSKSFNRYRCV